MPIDSNKFFDSIRIKPKKQAARQPVCEEAQPCQWPDCTNRGSHRAPKGRENAREYWHFCLDHVREYNQSYNFFSGMNAEAVARYQKDALTGHRPTWKMGANTSAKRGTGSPEADLGDASDPFSVFAEINGRGSWRPNPQAAPKAACSSSADPWLSKSNPRVSSTSSSACSGAALGPSCCPAC